MVARIVKVFPLNVNNYTDSQGVNKVFKTKAFILHDGRSSYFGEAKQENAESIEALNLQGGEVVNVHMTCNAREYKTKDAEVRYSNEFTITNMMKL